MKYAKVQPHYRSLFYERFLSWYDLVHDSSVSTDDFSTWSQTIWSKLFNLRADMRIFLTPSSNLQLRKLISPAFEFLLIEKNRQKYIDTLNVVYESLLKEKIPPGLPVREADYTPFFLECLSCQVKSRVEMKIPKPGVLEGQCPNCKEHYSYSYNPKHPDLSEIELSITPRSDSRAMVNNISFPLLIHIGGSGETQYYSAVIPAMKRLGVDPPIVVRSNRVYYNTPWGNKSAIANNSNILNEEMYTIFNKYNKAKNTKDI